VGDIIQAVNGASGVFWWYYVVRGRVPVPVVCVCACSCAMPNHPLMHSGFLGAPSDGQCTNSRQYE